MKSATASTTRARSTTATATCTTGGARPTIKTSRPRPKCWSRSTTPSPVQGYHVNGALTLGENIADNSGIAIAYKAYHLSLHGQPAPVIDGLTGDQRFYMGFAQVWR